MSWLFTSGGQSIGASASASVLPMNIQGWFLLGLTGLVSLLSKELSESSLAPQLKHQFFSLLYCPTLTFIHSILLWFSQRTPFLICFLLTKSELMRSSDDICIGHMRKDTRWKLRLISSLPVLFPLYPVVPPPPPDWKDFWDKHWTIKKPEHWRIDAFE